MKTILFFVPLILLISGTMYAQQVTIDGKQFKCGDSIYYPMIVNYTMDPLKLVGTSEYFVSPCHSYGATSTYECSDTLSCSNQILSDFNTIAGMKFNGARITGIAPYYIPGQGLCLTTVLSDDSDYDYLMINPNNPNDTGMKAMIRIYDKLLELASQVSIQPFKLILMPHAARTAFDSSEVSARNDFYNVLAQHLDSSIFRTSLLAIDLINEPYHHDTIPKTKEQACNIISTWYNTIKSNAPDVLVTIGSGGYWDVFDYDPAVLKLDFLSLHYYSDLAPYEHVGDTAAQQKSRERTANKLFWLSRNCPMPWIIGETGFTASASWDTTWGLQGTLDDMANYAEYSLNATCNCGGSGSSWWSYQDVNFDGTSSDNFWANFFGLLERGYEPGPVSEKPAVDIFRNYLPVVNGPCPVSYSPVYDSTKLYYDPYQFHLYNSIDTNYVHGKIIDQDGNPIEDAIIDARIAIQLYPDSDLHVFYPQTAITDQNGNFTIIPVDIYRINTDSTRYSFIGHMYITAAGAENTERGVWNDAPHVTPNDTIELNRINFKYDGIIYNKTISTSANTLLSGWNSLTIGNDVSITAGTTGDIKARTEIHLTDGFEALLGSDVHLYNAEVFSECPCYANYSRLANIPQSGRFDNISFNENLTDKNIELAFKLRQGDFFVSVYPNPSHGIFTIDIIFDNEENLNCNIFVYNTSGEEILQKKLSDFKFSLDLSTNPPGLYYMKVLTDKNSKIIKFINL
ncbi:MAG TPA: hypothetical protein DEH02_12280 [Bacteroidales bacterium]|nr:hypothetical protein [Bacteroidales bacterium]